MRLRHLNVGDTAYIVSRYGPSETKVVTKVGRRWVYFGDSIRFDRDTGAHDAGEYSSYYSAHESQETYEAKEAHIAAGGAIKLALSDWSVKITASVEDIEKAADLLGVRDAFERHRERWEAKQ